MNYSIGTFYFGVEIEEVSLSSDSHCSGKISLKCLSVSWLVNMTLFFSISLFLYLTHEYLLELVVYQQVCLVHSSFSHKEKRKKSVILGSEIVKIT